MAARWIVGRGLRKAMPVYVVLVLVLAALLAGCVAPQDVTGEASAAAGNAERVVWEANGLEGDLAYEFHMSVEGDGYCRLDWAFEGGWGSESGLFSYHQTFGNQTFASASSRGDTDVHVATVNPAGAIQGHVFQHMGAGWSSDGWSNATAGNPSHFIEAGFDVRPPGAEARPQMQVVCADAQPDISFRQASRVVPVTSTDGAGAGLRFWGPSAEGAANVADEFALEGARGTVFVGFIVGPGQSGPLNPVAVRDGTVTVATPDDTDRIRLADWDGWSSHHTLMDRDGDYALTLDQVALGAGSIVGLMAEFR